MKTIAQNKISNVCKQIRLPLLIYLNMYVEGKSNANSLSLSLVDINDDSF